MKLSREIICNGCEKLMWNSQSCKTGEKDRNDDPIFVPIPNTFTNDTGFVSVMRPANCPGKKERAAKEGA